MLPLFLAVVIGGVSTQGYYVSASGSDSNPGSLASPWQTITKVNATTTTGRTVHFNGGDRFEGALSLHSGTNYTSYGTGRATISGGVAITTWTQVDAPHNIWRASWNSGRPRALYVDGTRCVRARTSTGLPSGSTSNSGGYSTASSSNPGYLSTYGNKSDIEFVYYFDWRNSFVPVSNVVSNTITMLTTPWADFQANQDSQSKPYTVTYVENAYEIFTANNTAGTFYQDRSANFVYLIPPAGGDPNSMTVIAPVLDQVVTGSSVGNVTVSNLEFAHTTNLDINTAGFPEIQANICGQIPSHPFSTWANTKAAIDLNACTSVRFTRCLIRHLGTAGISVRSTSTNCELDGNIIYDTSGNGVVVGNGTGYTGLQPVNLSVNNNFIAKVGQEFQGAVGFLQWWAVTTNVTHNEVYKVPYTGISLGIGWGLETNPSGATGNQITYNDVHSYMLRMDDGGGIYENSHNPLALTTHNYCHDSGSLTGTVGGIYLDDGSQGNAVSTNVVVQYGTHALFFNNNINNNVMTTNTSDGGAYDVNPGPLTVAPNTYDTLIVVSTPSARLTGVALGTGLEPAYADVKAEADILVP